MPDLTKEQRAQVLNLLKDVAESEHQIRHPDAFSLLCESVGMEVVKEPHRVTARDPVADKAEADAKAAEEAAKPKDENPA